MNKFLHRVVIFLYVSIIIASTLLLIFYGYSYYRLPIEQRYEHALYNLLKPTGFIGHGLGIFGTLLIVVGLFGYMARKRLKIFSNMGMLSYWLEAHIFLCTLGTVLVLFHTTFKFGGLISVGFWSLAIVWISGVVGRFLYINIPRNIHGRELSLSEMLARKHRLDQELYEKYNIKFSQVTKTRFSQIKPQLVSQKVLMKEYGKVRSILREERVCQWRIKRLETLRNLFKYWHVIHLPFALIMLIIMMIHVGVALFFGYSWLFFK